MSNQLPVGSTHGQDNIQRPGRSGLFSEDELLKWLSVKPRTYNWDALVLYDRFQANRLLLQEYIDRYAKGTHFKPLTGAIRIADGTHWECLGNAVLDAPRLSFERSTVADSKAHLTMHLLSGLQFSVGTEAGKKRVTMINTHHPLQGSKLRLMVKLNESDGSVSKDGKVKINLATAEDFKVIFGTTEDMQSRLGSFFKNEFASWDADKKVFVLNEISRYEDGELFKPEEFRIRVTPAPGAALRDSGHYGDGAVMVFVASQGNPVGGYPDAAADWMYPIPEGRSATVLMSNEFLLAGMVADGIRKSPYLVHEDADDHVILDYVQENGGVETFIRVANGSFKAPRTEVHDSAFGGRTTSVLSQMTLVPDSLRRGEFTVKVDQSQCVYQWTGEVSSDHGNLYVYQRESSGHADYAMIDCRWNFQRQYTLGLSGERAMLLPSGTPVDDFDGVVTHVPERFIGSEADILRVALATVQSHVQTYFQSIIDVTGEIDAFRLHGILFRSADVMQPLRVAVPRDVVLFGDLAPSRTSFVIDPLESVVQAGKTLKLTTLPAQNGTEWKVEAVDGFGGVRGSIAQDGTYSAPSPANMSGKKGTLVRITASAAGKTSSALVRVVTQPVHVNPLVALAPNNGFLKIAGGAVHGEALTWTIESATGATLTDVPPKGDAEYEPGDQFYIPGTVPSDTMYTVDKVTATNAAKDASATSYIVVTNGTPVGSYSTVKEPGLADNQIKLVLSGGLGPVAATWKVLAGTGSVDENGIYTAERGVTDGFAVVSGYFLSPGVAEFNAVLILPVPLVDLDSLTDSPED